MDPEERKLMITIGSALTDLQKRAMPILERLEAFMGPAATGTSVVPVAPSDVVHVSGRPSVVSSVEHERGPGLQNFKMDIVFENASAMEPKARMDTSIALLSEMEELLREYKVRSLTGTYGPQ